MPTLLLNLKKCLTVSLAAALLSSHLLLAAVSPRPSVSDLRNDIASASPTKQSFEPLFRLWEERYGSSVVGPLLEMSRDARAPDPQRYIGIMGAARLGGRPTAPLLVPFLKDGSWMIRAATLRALTALDHAETSATVLPLLKDPALVVRMEAVSAVQALKPVGGATALVDAVFFEGNYREGKALWVPQKALVALASLGSSASSSAPRLRPLLDRLEDPEILQETIRTLEALQGRKIAPSLPLRMQAAEWKRALSLNR